MSVVDQMKVEPDSDQDIRFSEPSVDGKDFKKSFDAAPKYRFEKFTSSLRPCWPSNVDYIFQKRLNELAGAKIPYKLESYTHESLGNVITAVFRKGW